MRNIRAYLGLKSSFVISEITYGILLIKYLAIFVRIYVINDKLVPIR